MKRKYVSGIAVGYALKNGEYTEDLSIRIHVIKKIDDSKLTKKQIFPKRILGIRVDVVQMTVISQHAQAPNADYQEGLAASPGMPIVTSRANIGTIGLIVEGIADRQLYALCAAHVLENEGDEVYQPNAILAPTAIGKVKEILTPPFDAGIFNIDQRPTSNTPEGSSIRITSIKTISNKEVLQFAGSQVGTTYGRAFFTGEMSVLRHNGEIVSIRGFGMEPANSDCQFSLSGDSGGLWFNDSGAAVGLLVGLSKIIHTDKISGQQTEILGFFACHISEVMEKLKIKLPNT